MARAETWGSFSLDKVYLIRSASSWPWYGLRSKKSLQALSQKITSWCLACSYSGGGCASHLVVSPMAFPNARENHNASQVASSSSSFPSGPFPFLAGLSSCLPFSGDWSWSSLSPPPGAHAAACCGDGGPLPVFPPPAALALGYSVGSDCFPFPFRWAFREITSSDSSAILPSCCLRSSLLALSSCMTSLQACPCSRRACWFWALWSNNSLPIFSSLAIASDPSAWIYWCNWEHVAWWCVHLTFQ